MWATEEVMMLLLLTKKCVALFVKFLENGWFSAEKRVSLYEVDVKHNALQCYHSCLKVSL